MIDPRPKQKGRAVEQGKPDTDTYLREATVSDIPAIAAIYGEAVLNGTGTFEIEPPDVEEMGYRVVNHQSAKFPWLVYDVDGTIAGYGTYGPFRTRPAYAATVENAVYVDPRFQRQGIGYTILTGLISHAINAGFLQMIAVIGDSANESSINLHKSVGFEQAGLLRNVGYKHERWLDCVLMQRALGDT